MAQRRAERSASFFWQKRTFCRPSPPIKGLVAYCGLDSSTAKRGWMPSIKGHDKPDVALILPEATAPVLRNSSTDTVELRELTEEDVKRNAG